MPHRPPTRHDIGKTVEVGIQNDWFDAELVSFTEHEGYTEYEFRWAPDDTDTDTCFECRVPYTTPDPIAELAQAADWLAERGQDEASRVLLYRIKTIRLMQTSMDVAETATFAAEFQDLRNRFARLVMESHGLPPNPPEPQ